MVTSRNTEFDSVLGDKKTWEKIQYEINQLEDREPVAYSYLRGLLQSTCDFRSALAAMLSHQLFHTECNSQKMVELICHVIYQSPAICEAAAADLEAFYERDPACKGYVPIFFFSKGFAALQIHRIAHHLWLCEQYLSALMLQAKSSLVYSVDIHPAARLGRSIFLDHATGLVIGETSVVEDGVSILQEVTLGGTGKHPGDRHPKVRKGVLLCAGVKILGNIEIGEGAKVGAGSVVLHSVPPYSTVVGVPARVVGFSNRNPASVMDQTLAT
ncbi:serine O-acetyltransferase [Aeromonas piscicola]